MILLLIFAGHVSVFGQAATGSQTSEPQAPSPGAAAGKPATKPATAKPAPPRSRGPRAAQKPAARPLAPVEDETPMRAGDIDKILIKGNKKIEVDAIRAKLISREGAPYSAETIRQDIGELFGTGYFYDVIVDRTDNPKITLTYTVVEKPSIAEIVFEGNDEIEDDELKETAGIKAYEIVNQAKIREATEKLEKLYEDKGFFLARVTSKLTPTGEGDNVKLEFTVRENDKVRVKRVSFIGNKKMDSGKLKAAMITQEGGFFSFVSGSGAYKQEAFDRDVQVLNLVYFNEGYVQVKIDRPQVYVTPDKKAIYISIRIEEGEQFKVGSVDFTGDLLFSREELFETTQIEEQDLFRYQILQDDLKALQAKYGDLGYAYANPIPRTRIREADREVDITFEIDKGQKVYIGKIVAVGNSKTRDKVIRRELRILEGELYNETRKRESIDNVKRLGYFEEVNFNTKTPKGRNDIMDIDIVVKERNTGTIQVGAGYSSFNGLVFNGQVSQTNFLGKGQKLNVSIDLSKRQSLYKFGFTEPYLFDTEWSGGFDVFRSQRLLTEYEETKTGGALRVGHPLAPYLDGFIRYKLDETDLHVDEVNGDPDLFPVDTANGTTSSVTFTLEYDKRDDRFTPSKGMFSSVSLEYAGVGGSKDYTKGFGTFRYYKKLFWELVWRNNITYGFISSNDSSKEVPFNELFLLGGANSLRGFDWFSVGKRKRSEKRYDQARGSGMSPQEAENEALRPFGGTQQFFYNLEFQFPLITEAGIKGVVFYDIGQADDALILEELRQDVGFGFRWFSPIGPLRFEWGFPLERQERFDEDNVNFEFAIGAPF
ncbi:MAG TPA: outer membrane protein assembly factor BamA [Bdellovibrionales bacterium]|nr:outer membrane protein assembly factor BamA [Bdellovibrionales bacterium]